MKFFTKSFFLVIAILLLSAVLRLYHLGKVPPSLYSDEASQGYNAYSLLITGKDEYGQFLPVSLRSFGDWKPPLSTYLMIPAIFINGLNEASVRLPSSILGISSVYFTYLLAKEILGKIRGREKIALLSSLILAISPWHILQSRAAMLVIISFSLLILGILLLIKGKIKENNYYWGIFFLSLSVYAYYGMRVIAPIIFITLFFITGLYRKVKTSIFVCLIGLIMILPLMLSFIKNPDVVFGRAKTVSVFYDQGTNLRLWELTTQDGISANPFLTRFFHNRPYLYAKKITQNFFAHFSGIYLLIDGDKAQPFHTPGSGIIYFLDIIFIQLGIIFIFNKKISGRNFLLLFLIISIIPAALTFMVPSSNRTFNSIFGLGFLSACGMYLLSQKIKFKIPIILFSFLYMANFAYFMKVYFIEIPKNHAGIWNYGWKEAVDYISKFGKSFDNIVVSDINGMPYIYFLFYNKYDPHKFQNESIRTYSGDRFGFEHVEGFGKYVFLNEFDWNQIKENPLKNSLYIVPVSEIPENISEGDDIKYPDGKTVIKIFKYE